MSTTSSSEALIDYWQTVKLLVLFVFMCEGHAM